MMPGLTGIVYPRARTDHLLFLSALLLAATVVASLYPAWKAAGLTPVEAIRGVRTALGRRLRRLPRIALPFPARAVFARIALRGLARNPRRAALTLGSLGAGAHALDERVEIDSLGWRAALLAGLIGRLGGAIG